MSERNRDKIKKLKHEIGRYEKRCGDLMKLNAQLSKRASGVAEISIATDALFAQVAIAYGEDAVDPDTGGGHRQTPDAAEVRRTGNLSQVRSACQKGWRKLHHRCRSAG